MEAFIIFVDTSQYTYLEKKIVNIPARFFCQKFKVMVPSVLFYKSTKTWCVNHAVNVLFDNRYKVRIAFNINIDLPGFF